MPQRYDPVTMWNYDVPETPVGSGYRGPTYQATGSMQGSWLGPAGTILTPGGSVQTTPGGTVTLPGEQPFSAFGLGQAAQGFGANQTPPGGASQQSSGGGSGSGGGSSTPLYALSGGAYGGGVPAVTAPPTVQQTLTQDLGAQQQLQQLTSLINSINQTAQHNANMGRIPGEAGLEEQSSTNIGGALRGELPSDVISLLQQQGAEQGYGFGTDSPATRSALLRSLGLSSLNMMDTGQRWLTGATARNPAAPIADPSQFLLTPNQAAQTDLERQRLAQQQAYQQQQLAQREEEMAQNARIAEEQIAAQRLANLGRSGGGGSFSPTDTRSAGAGARGGATGATGGDGGPAWVPGPADFGGGVGYPSWALNPGATGVTTNLLGPDQLMTGSSPGMWGPNSTYPSDEWNPFITQGTAPQSYEDFMSLYDPSADYLYP